jgi:protein TonB
LIGYSQSSSSANKNISYEESTHYPGGMDAFNHYVEKNLKYPRDARKGGIQGKVLVEFDVDAGGDLVPGSIKILKSLFRSCNDEAIRLVRQSSPWIPGTYNGRPILQKMVVGIPFVLEEK